jgi:hypothetical protein
MHTSTIQPASPTLHSGNYYPYSAQYKGDGWHVHNAATNEYDEAARAEYNAKHGIFAG